MSRQKFKLSVITPFYNEEPGGIIEKYFQAVLPILEKITPDYEVVCIDDGSTDRTYELLCRAAKANPAVKVIRLSRNFGKEAALTAGFDHCVGDCVIPFDADLQDPPHLFADMVKLWQEGYDVVLPKRVKRGDSWFKKVTASLFYHLINMISTTDIQYNVGDFRLLDQKAVRVIRRMREKKRFMRGIMSYPGFKTRVIKYSRPERDGGITKFNCKAMIKLSLDAVFSFSILPIRLFLFLGMLIALISVIWGLSIIYAKIFHGNVISGYASTMVAILFLNAVVLMGMGILGEYVGRIYEEVKDRPIYGIAETCNLNEESCK